MPFMSRPTPALLLAALLLGGCADEQAPAAIPRADGHYVRVVALAEGQRSAGQDGLEGFFHGLLSPLVVLLKRAR